MWITDNDGGRHFVDFFFLPMSDKKFEAFLKGHKGSAHTYFSLRWRGMVLDDISEFLVCNSFLAFHIDMVLMPNRRPGESLSCVMFCSHCVWSGIWKRGLLLLLWWMNSSMNWRQ